MNDKIDFSILNENKIKTMLFAFDESILRNVFIQCCKDLDVKSKYYVGKKGNGKFWNGFRIQAISKEKIILALADEYKKSTKEIDVEKLILKCLDKQYKIETIDKEKLQEIAKIKGIDFAEILAKFLSIDTMNEEELNRIKIDNVLTEQAKKIITIEKELKQKYSQKEALIKKENEKLKKENKKLKSEFEKLKFDIIENDKKSKKRIDEINELNIKKYQILLEQYNNQKIENKYLSDQIFQVKNENMKYENLFKTKVKNSIKNKVLDYFEEKKYNSKEEVKENYIELINELKEKINSNSDVEDIIVEIYILNRMMES